MPMASGQDITSKLATRPAGRMKVVRRTSTRSVPAPGFGPGDTDCNPLSRGSGKSETAEVKGGDIKQKPPQCPGRINNLDTWATARERARMHRRNSRGDCVLEPATTRTTRLPATPGERYHRGSLRRDHVPNPGARGRLSFAQRCVTTTSAFATK